MKRLLVPCAVMAIAPLSAAVADLPYTFKAGDPIRASELNANFQYLESLGAGGEFGLLTRRRATLSASGFRDVATVPSTSTNGWVLRSYVSNCGTLLFRIDNDSAVPVDKDAILVVRPGETLSARCASSASETNPVGYFMFNEQ
jgi:hypothetical protein